MNIILSRYHQCETPSFGAHSGDLSERITSRIAESRRDYIYLYEKLFE
jgi:hypothetical protein